MRRQIVKLIGILCMTTVFVACGRNDKTDMEDDTKQLIEVLDAENHVIRQEVNNTIITQLCESEEIEKWESISSMPKEATKCYTYASYALVTDPYWKESDAPEIAVGLETLYQSGEEYYMEESCQDAEQGISNCYQIPKEAGISMIQFASEESETRDKEDIFASWGITYYELLDGTDTVEEDDIRENYNFLEEDSLYQEENVLGFETPISANDLKKVSKKQKVEINYTDGNEVTMSDLEDIANLYNGLKLENWVEIGQLPDTTEEICTMKYYQLKRRKFPQKFVENNEMSLYKADGKCYIVDYIALQISEEAEDMKSYYEVPQQAAEYVEALQ